MRSRCLRREASSSSGAMRELTGAIADFPGERADDGESIAAPEDELASRRKHRDRKIG